MKYSVDITPLNCSYGLGLNSIITMEESEHVANTGRSIFCKNIDTSWFKMKSSTITPYLEPVFYGLTQGDIVTVEFDALLLSGEGGINFNFVKVNPDYSTLDLGGAGIPTGSMKSFYKRFKVSNIISHDGIGTIVNLRPNGTNNEMVIKNIVVEIETTNPHFSLTNNITAFRTKTDFKTGIDYYAGTNINPTYHSLLTLLNEGKATFPDNNTLQFTNAGTTVFKGLMTLFNGTKYRQPIAVYAEYVSPSNFTATSKAISEDGVFTQSGTVGFTASSVVRKQIKYFYGGVEPTRKTLIDIGMVGLGTDLTLKNVRFSMPQFDDSVKRAPNKLEELYTNLSAKLR